MALRAIACGKRRSLWLLETFNFLSKESPTSLADPIPPLLNEVKAPADLRQFSDSDLVLLAQELRAETISDVSETGGHLGAGLGVVELTVALHAVFDTPRDRLIWDVGHQSYPHKMLTGRWKKFVACVKKTASAALLSATNRRMTPLAQRIVQPRSAQPWVLQWRSI